LENDAEAKNSRFYIKDGGPSGPGGPKFIESMCCNGPPPLNEVVQGGPDWWSCFESGPPGTTSTALVVQAQSTESKDAAPPGPLGPPKNNKSLEFAQSEEPSKPTLADIDSEATGTLSAEWKADMLNRLFAEHGVLGEPAKITAATVQDGLNKFARAKRSQN